MTKFWDELSKLTEAGTCKLLTDTPERRIYISQYYTDMIRDAYLSSDTMTHPFPSEESLGISLQAGDVRILNVDHELLSAYFADPQESLLPIIKFTFTEPKFGSCLMLASMISRGLLEAALLKVKGYLQHQDNVDYVRYRLSPKLRGKENYLGNVLNQLSTEPLEFLDSIEEAGESSYLFWLHFCTLIKHDIIEKYEPLAQDIAIIQAAYLIEQCNNYYRGKMDKESDREAAIEDLSRHFEKAPYLYTIDEVIKFTNKSGIPLLEQYSREDLQAYLEAKTSASEDNKLPELLTFWGTNNEQWFVQKNRFFALSARLIIEIRPVVKQALTERWLAILKDYNSEPAMKDDEELESLLTSYIKELMPPLAAIMRYKKLPFLYTEAAGRETAPESLRLFNKGMVSPMKEVLLINREKILAAIRITLPFWYSIPLLVRINAFFRHFGKKPQTFIIERSLKHKDSGPATTRISADSQDPFYALESDLVPDGYTLDTYLTTLEDRWNQLLNKHARENLAEDINSLIRNRVRLANRSLKPTSITAERLDEMASELMLQIADLNRLNEKNALQLYIKLDILKLLQKK
ncbi:MAG: hypothetical protein LBT13_01135 [Treponema sp.]|nr:hypothetical protein [Treponema sp.]